MAFAAEVARLRAYLDADTSSFDRKMRSSETTTQRFGRVAKTALIGGAAAGLYAFGKAAKIGWDEYTQGAKVGAQTNAVIKSTGGVANVSATQVHNLASALMLKSGVDDEAIASGENVLLTFTKVHNEAGRGNDIFNQATAAALDLSVALGTDLQSANIQLGKALNGSSTGLSALARSGVSFSDKQRELIGHLFDTNRTLDAQKIILQEVQKEFGGSAKAAGETLPGKLAILRERFNNFAGDMVERVIPVVSDFADFISDVSTGKTVSIKIHTALSGIGSSLERLLFGTDAQRVRVPVDQRHFEWVVQGGDNGLVGAIGDAIRDINWTAVGNQIAEGMKQVGQKAGDTFTEELGSTLRDKATSPGGLLGAWWSATKVQAEFFPATHIWRAIWGKIEGDAEAATKNVNGSLGDMAGEMIKTQNKGNTFADAMSEHMRQVSNDTLHSSDAVETLRGSVDKLRSKTIHVNAVVNGLSYVTALQEHLDLIRDTRTDVNVTTTRPGHNATGTSNWRGGMTWVGERGPELVNLPRGSQVIPNNKIAAGNVYLTVNAGMGTDGRHVGEQILRALEDWRRRGGR